MSLQSFQPEPLSLWWKLTWHTYLFNLFWNASFISIHIASKPPLKLDKHIFFNEEPEIVHALILWNCLPTLGGFHPVSRLFFAGVRQSADWSRYSKRPPHLFISGAPPRCHQRCLEGEKGVCRAVTPLSVTWGRKPNGIPGGEDDCCECKNSVGEPLVQQRGHARGWWERLTGYQSPTDIAHS